MEADDLHIQNEFEPYADDQRSTDRLDAVAAERVIARAIELEAAAAEMPHVITTDQLEKVAREIGVDPVFVHQALGEERIKGIRRSRIDTWILPSDIIEVATLHGMSRAEADLAIDRWMRINEGLTRGARVSGGIEWHVDRRWMARLRAASLSGSDRISRIAGGEITHRIHSLGESEHLVSLESRGERPLLLAKLAATASAVVGLTGIAIAAIDGPDGLLAGLAGFIPLSGGLTALGVFGARQWAMRIRRALRRSLTGLVERGRTDRRRRAPRRHDP